MKNYFFKQYCRASQASFDWAADEVQELTSGGLGSYTVLDIGGADGKRLRNRGVKTIVMDAEHFDLNFRWPLPADSYDVIHSAQVIEHLHCPLPFLKECYRTLREHCYLVLTSENLLSFMNGTAWAAGVTPFSLSPIAGTYLGNRFSPHYREKLDIAMDPEHRCWSGVSGHVRVLDPGLLRELLELAGFQKIWIGTIGFLPLPEWAGRWFPNRGHFIMARARK